MGGHRLGRGVPLQATLALLAGEWVRRVKPEIEAALEDGRDLAADAAALFAGLRGLSDESAELALRVIDRHVPEGWDAFVVDLCAEVDSRDRERRRWAAETLLHIAGGRIGARYRSGAKPHLIRPAIWQALLRCCAHGDNVLRKRIAPGFADCSHLAEDLGALVPSIVELLDGPSRKEAIRALVNASLRGADVSEALPSVEGAADGALLRVVEYLRAGDAAAALAEEPSSYIAQQIGTPLARWPDTRPVVELFAALLDHADPDVRIRACEGLESLARRGADIGPTVAGLEARLGDRARARLSGQVGVYAAGALARAGAGSVLRDKLGAGGPAAEHAAFGLGSLACADASLDLESLIESTSSKTRAAVYAGVAGGAKRGDVGRVTALLELIERISRKERGEAQETSLHAIDNLCLRLRRLGPEGAVGLASLARSRWELAREIGLYDDSKAIAAIARINDRALETDPEHAGALELQKILARARADAIS